MTLVTGDSLSLLLFRLHSGRLLGINLLKVNEVIDCPPLTKLPNRHPNIRGIAMLRGFTLTVIDLGAAIGERGVSSENDEGCLIVTEVNRSRQGMLVKNVERIVPCSTRDVRPPPAGAGSRAFITGVVQIDGDIVQVLDIEKVLHEITPEHDHTPTEQLLEPQDAKLLQGRRVLIVDDSSVALQQTVSVLRQLGLDCTAVRSGQAALEQLHEYREAGMPFELLVSDIEMPEIDGYSLVQEIRRSSDIADTYVLLHTSLDSTMNTEKARAVGANAILTKFSAVDLTRLTLDAFRQISAR
ncbi:chemotaxis protein CheV [Pseudomonas sp. NCHU5208]|uniref:chemotaxis protein CheV n=1 Tax=unclassified Pseudomonas TaxID=196821 RepID=UPI003F9D43CB